MKHHEVDVASSRKAARLPPWSHKARADGDPLQRPPCGLSDLIVYISYLTVHRNQNI